MTSDPSHDYSTTDPVEFQKKLDAEDFGPCLGCGFQREFYCCDGKNGKCCKCNDYTMCMSGRTSP